MATVSDLRRLVDDTPFVDTHEHLLEERTRLGAAGESGHPACCQRDFSVLLSHYADSDLAVAGMTPAEAARLFSPDVEPRDKWRMVAPYYRRARHTGYLQTVRESVRRLYGEDDLDEDAAVRISERIAAAVAPGYYRPILEEASGIEHCQVNSLEDPLLMETQYPDLLCQDLSFVALSTGLDVGAIAPRADIDVNGLADWHRVIDWAFETLGPKAIAVKNQSAYGRKLDYAQVSAGDAAPLFERHLRDAGSLTGAERKALEDHLFHVCVTRATEAGLPVKLHTGYYAGHGRMPLHRLRHNAGDLADLLAAHPQARFVIMHITYPYQDEAIALAKHFPNAWVDLCWAWIINPLAGVRFVREFLMAAPANKLLTFGGDYMPVEMVPGHAALARKGLAQALSELVEEGWLADDDLPELVERLMRGNAHELFDYEGTLAAWPAGAA